MALGMLSAFDILCMLLWAGQGASDRETVEQIGACTVREIDCGGKGREGKARGEME